MLGCARALDVVVVGAATEPFFELEVEVVVIGGVELAPLPSLADEVVEATVEGVEDVEDIEVEVDMIVAETDEVDWRAELVVKSVDADLEVVVVLNPRPPVTPLLSVGIVTDTAGAVELTAIDVAVDRAVVLAKVGHSAVTILPPFTIPNSVLGFTIICAQASLTLCATEFNPAIQAVEHPLLKSDFVQEGI